MGQRWNYRSQLLDVPKHITTHKTRNKKHVRRKFAIKRISGNYLTVTVVALIRQCITRFYRNSILILYLLCPFYNAPDITLATPAAVATSCCMLLLCVKSTVKSFNVRVSLTHLRLNGEVSLSDTKNIKWHTI